MKIRNSVIAAAACMLLATPNAFAEGLSAKWKNGIRLQSDDGNVKIKIGGRIMNDWTFHLSSDDSLEAAVGKLEDGNEFRRARLYVAGELYKDLEFKAQYDFAGGDADFKDMYLGLKNLSFGGIRVGHQKEAFGLAELTSSKYITFLERPVTGAFTPGRNTGVQFHGNAMDKELVWAAGVFRESDNFGDSGDDGDALNFTARLAGTPVYEEDSIVHIGASYTQKSAEDDTIRFRSRPEIHDGPRYVDTGDIMADDASLWNIELAGVFGPLSAQAEWTNASVNLKDGAGSSDPDFTAWYAQASYFLTGESRSYKKGKGVFGRVKPNSSFIGGDGNGAWEVALRVSELDLNDAGVTGGELSNVTVGLNWYLHANARIMLNYINADVDGVGDSSTITTRFQADF